METQQPSQPKLSVTVREKRNWLIYQYFVSKNFKQCYKLIEDQFKESEGVFEYGMYIKGIYTV
jgi:hypothetical protein